VRGSTVRTLPSEPITVHLILLTFVPKHHPHPTDSQHKLGMAEDVVTVCSPMRRRAVKRSAVGAEWTLTRVRVV
jgi:hypothetical protein